MARTFGGVFMYSLSQSEIQSFKKQLRDRALELRRAIHGALIDSDNKTYSEVAGRVLDIGEQSVVDLLADFRIFEIEKEVSELSEVEAALARIDAGTYARCADCGADISVERLRAYPSANRCTDCQARHERMAKDMTPSL